MFESASNDGKLQRLTLFHIILMHFSKSVLDFCCGTAICSKAYFLYFTVISGRTNIPICNTAIIFLIELSQSFVLQVLNSLWPSMLVNL